MSLRPQWRLLGNHTTQAIHRVVNDQIDETSLSGTLTETSEIPVGCLAQLYGFTITNGQPWLVIKEIL